MLSETKVLLKKKNWVAFTESGLLSISGRIARDLVSAYESWLKNTSIPEGVLTQVSARTLAKIGKVGSSKRMEIEKILQKKGKYTENDLSKIIKKPLIKKNLDNFTRAAESKVNNMNDSQKIKLFPKLFLENFRLKRRVKQLEEELMNLKLATKV